MMCMVNRRGAPPLRFSYQAAVGEVVEFLRIVHVLFDERWVNLPPAGSQLLAAKSAAASVT